MCVCVCVCYFEQSEHASERLSHWVQQEIKSFSEFIKKKQKTFLNEENWHFKANSVFANAIMMPSIC